MNYNNYKKLIIISILLFIVIYILYIDTDFDILSIINNNNIVNFKENYTNYVNICKNGEVPHFYNLSNSNQVFTTTLSGCDLYCDLSNTCDLYTLKGDNNSCFLHDLSNIDTLINVQCSGSKKNTTNYSDSDYNGIGFVKNDFYNNNQSKFNHINYLFEKSNSIINTFKDIKSDISNMNFNDLTSNHINITDDIHDIEKYYDESLNLFTSLFKHSEVFNYPETSITFMDSSINYDNFYKIFNSLNETNETRDGKSKSDNLENNRQYLVYIILSFLLVITFLILIIYIFVPKIISNLFMFFYFIGIIFLVFFVHLILRQ